MRVLIFLIAFFSFTVVYGQFDYLDAKAQRADLPNATVNNGVKATLNTFYGLPQSLIQGINTNYVGELDIFLFGVADLFAVTEYRRGYVRMVGSTPVYNVVDYPNKLVVDVVYGLSTLKEYQKNFINQADGTTLEAITLNLLSFYLIDPNSSVFDEFATPTGNIGNVVNFMVGKGDIRYNVFAYCFIDAGGNVFFYVHDPANGFIVWRGV